MSGKATANIILVYASLLFFGAVYGALLTRDFSVSTIPASALLLLGPAIGVHRQINWCRIYLGVWAVFVFGIYVSFSFRPDFHFGLAYLGILLGTGLPVFLLFFYPPLKRYTQNAAKREPSS